MAGYCNNDEAQMIIKISWYFTIGIIVLFCMTFISNEVAMICGQLSFLLFCFLVIGYLMRVVNEH